MDGYALGTLSQVEKIGQKFSFTTLPFSGYETPEPWLAHASVKAGSFPDLATVPVR